MSQTTLLDRWGDAWHDRLCRRTAEAILGLHVVGDWASTQLVISQAATYGLDPHQSELNPLLSTWAGEPLKLLGVMLTAGLGLIMLLAYEDRRLARGESEQTTPGRVVLWGVIVLGVVIVVWNIVNAAVFAIAPI